MLTNQESELLSEVWSSISPSSFNYSDFYWDAYDFIEDALFRLLDISRMTTELEQDLYLTLLVGRIHGQISDPASFMFKLNVPLKDYKYSYYQIAENLFVIIGCFTARFPGNLPSLFSNILSKLNNGQPD